MGVKYRKIIAPAIVMLLVAAVWYKTGIYFETNDDKCITEILCGRMTGAPLPYTYYVSYLLALPVSLFYRITADVPWYGLTLIFFQITAYTAVLESVYSRCGKIWEMAAGTGFVAAVFLMNLYLLGCIEFTSTPGLLAAAGYFCLLVQKDNKKGWIYFCLLEFMAGLLRLNAMLMIQPMGFLMMGGALLARRELSSRQRASSLLKVMAVPAAVCLLICSVNGVVYRGSDWKAYMKYSDGQVVLFDYLGLPYYDEVQDTLDRYGVSETDYNAYANYMMLDWVLPSECVQEVAAYAQERHEPLSAAGLWEKLSGHLFGESYWGLNGVLVFLWTATVVLALVWRAPSLLLSAFGLLSGKLFCWAFLLYRGRFPLRVSMPLLAGEILLLLALLLHRGTEAEQPGERERLPVLSCGGTEDGHSGGRKRLRYWGLAALLLGMCTAGYLTARQQYSYILAENTGQKIFMEGLREIRAYCNDHPGNRYVFDAVSMSHYRGSALECEIYGESNYIVSGNWYANSPYLRRYNAEYLSGSEGFYFIVYDDGRGLGHPGVAYLIQETGRTPEGYERFAASHGGVYLIYYFEGV